MIDYFYCYDTKGNQQINVRLDGKLVGTIKSAKQKDGKIYGYQYFPKNVKDGGTIFQTLGECKDDLDGRIKMTLENLPSKSCFKFVEKHLNNTTVYKKLCKNRFTPTFKGITSTNMEIGYLVLKWKDCKVVPVQF